MLWEEAYGPAGLDVVFIRRVVGQYFISMGGIQTLFLKSVKCQKFTEFFRSSFETPGNNKLSFFVAFLLLAKSGKSRKHILNLRKG